MNPSPLEILLLIYLVGAAVACVYTWIDNTRVFYVNGPPSGIFTGLSWPFWGIPLIAILIWRAGIGVLEHINPTKEQKENSDELNF